MIARRALLAWLVVIAALVSGCSSSGGTGGPAAPPSAAGPIAAGAGVCDYLTPADVHGFGQNVSYPGKQGHDYDFGPSCDYGGAVFTLVDSDVSKAAFTSYTSKQVPGIGDHAYYGSDYEWLRVAAGHTRFELRCLLCAEPALATMSAVAKSVVPRLPH